MARRLGVPTGAPDSQLIAAVAAAARRPSAEVEAILYGDAPGDDAEMLDVVHKIDILESEVQQT